MVRLPVDELDIGEDIWDLLEAPRGHGISAIKLGLTMHNIRFPVGHHCIGEEVDHKDPNAVKYILKYLAETITL